MDAIARNWQDVLARVAGAADRAGRAAEEVTVVAVTKTRSAEEVEAAVRAGVTDVGENRVQEAEAKRAAVGTPARWHLIGSLQRNKAAKALDTFDVVQSVDSVRLADALERRAAERERHLQVLLQVNTSGAEGQGGAAPDDVHALVEHVAGLAHLRLAGLMTIAAHDDDPEVVRACFRRLREQAEALRNRVPEVDLSVLSMGMSGDFELAILEGATLVRIGTAIFGSRPAA